MWEAMILGFSIPSDPMENSPFDSSVKKDRD